MKQQTDLLTVVETNINDEVRMLKYKPEVTSNEKHSKTWAGRISFFKVKYR